MSVLSKVRLSSEPYPICIATDCIPEYEELSATRPDWRRIAGDKAEQNNVRCDVGALEILYSDFPVTNIWKRFVREHTSREFYQEWLEIFRPQLNFYYPWLEWALGKPLEDLNIGIRGQEHSDIYLDCQLSINTPVKEKSSVIGPHLDNPTELFGSMLYMKNDDAKGGDLLVYEVEKPSVYGKRSIKNGTPVAKIPYEANKYIGFLNTYKSVHGVTEREVTENPRLMVNISIELCDKRKKLFNPELYRD